MTDSSGSADPARPGLDQSLRVLVVEDEALVALDLEAMLDDLGHVVVGVAGGVARALVILGEQGGELDAAVLDANLGGASSRPVADALRARGIPFVVASGYGTVDLNRFGFEGATLQKPCRADQVRTALARLHLA